MQCFVNRYLMSIMDIHWPDAIREEELWERARQENIDIHIRRSKRYTAALVVFTGLNTFLEHYAYIQFLKSQY